MDYTRRPRALITSFFILNLFSAAAHAIGVTGQGTWETTLQARDFDGNTATIEGYYDSVLDVTWLADANYAGTTMNWAAANSWAAGLDFGPGIDNWRLPGVNPVDGTTADDATLAFNGSEDRGYNVSAPGTTYAGSTASELAHLFYNTLGNLGACSISSTTTCLAQAGSGLSNTGPFSNLQSGFYWTGTVYVPNTSAAWHFGFIDGVQINTLKTNANVYAWAVHAGDVGTAVTPVPAAVWLFGSGLLGLAGVARRRRRQR